LIDDDPPDGNVPPGGGNAEKRRLVGACSGKPGDDLVRSLNLFLHGPLHVREGKTHSSENVFQSIEARSLSWERDFFDDVVSEKFIRGVEFAMVDNAFNELMDLG